MNQEASKIYQKNYREVNKEKLKISKKNYYEANKEKIKQDAKNYRDKNKDKVLKKDKERYKDQERKEMIKLSKIKNKDKILERERKRYKNPKRMKAKTEFSKNYAKENASKIRAKKYNLTEEEVNAFHIKQKNLCGICGCEEKSRMLSIDHCHKTGKVRGLLCRKCNLGLGNFADSKELLQKALIWLTQE